MTLAQFVQDIETYKVKFTKPQKAVVNRILDGDKLAIVNQHRMNGGEYMWSNDEGETLQYAGKVYKAFWNISYAMRNAKRKVTGQYEDDYDMNFAIVQNNRLTY